MRRWFSTSVLAVLVLVASAMAALSGGHASASGAEAPIAYNAFVDDSSFAEGGMTEQAPGMYFRFGADDLHHPDLFDVAFDLFVTPSEQSQVYYAFVNSDPGAAALADEIYNSGGQGVLVGVGSSFRPGPSGVHFTIPNTRFVSPPGGRILYFKLTIPPFRIDQETLYPSFGPPQPGNALHPEGGPMDIVEAFGPPPAGDANCDAAINSLDALVMLEHGAGLLDTLSCAKAADVTHDGTVDARDLQLVLQFSAGLIEAL